MNTATKPDANSISYNDRLALAARLRAAALADIFADLDETSDPVLYQQMEQFQIAVTKAAELLESPPLRYVYARTEGENVDLIVRAGTGSAAEAMWRDYFKDWDLPARPERIAEVQTFGGEGVIRWKDIVS